MMRWTRREVMRGCGALMAGVLVGCQRQQGQSEQQSQPGQQSQQQAPVEIESVAGSPPAQSGEPTVEDVRGILNRRAAALKNDDEQAFLADLDPSNKKLIKRQRRLFSNLRQFDLREVRLLADEIFSFGLPPPEGVGFDVIQITQLTADSAPGGMAPAEAYQYTLAKRDSKTVVTDITAITARNYKKLHSNAEVFANAPWNTSKLHVLNVGNVWLAGDDSVPDLERYAAVAKRQVSDVQALWGDRPRFPGSVLFLTREKSNFLTWFDFGSSDLSEPERFEGFQHPLRGVSTSGDLGDMFDRQYAGSRIVVNLANTDLFGDDPQRVMRHELVHAVTAKATSVDINLSTGGSLGGAPRWAIEGSARWIDSMESAERQAQRRAIIAHGVGARKFDGTPPLTDTFYDADDISFNYEVSASIFDLIERDHGREAAIEFCAQTIKQDDGFPPLVEQRGFDKMCRQIMGMNGDAFLGEWSDFVRAGA